MHRPSFNADTRIILLCPQSASLFSRGGLLSEKIRQPDPNYL